MTKETLYDALNIGTPGEDIQPWDKEKLKEKIQNAQRRVKEKVNGFDFDSYLIDDEDGDGELICGGIYSADAKQKLIEEIEQVLKEEFGEEFISTITITKGAELGSGKNTMIKKHMGEQKNG